MIRASIKEANLLLTGWKEDELWIGAAISLGEDFREEHRFWCKVAEVGAEKVVLAGKNALVEVPFEQDVVCEYSEVSEAPDHLRDRFRGLKFCLTIRSQRVLSLLFGKGPKIE